MGAEGRFPLSSGAEQVCVLDSSCFAKGNFPWCRQIHLVELLVAHGADLNGKSVLDETPLGESSR